MSGRYVITEAAVDRVFEIDKRRYVRKIAQLRAIGLHTEADQAEAAFKDILTQWAAEDSKKAS